MEQNNVTAMNPSELIRWCRQRKETLGLTNSALARMTGIPEGTIDRVFSGRYTEFKYSTIQPILVLLTGYREETPEPDDPKSEQSRYYYDTIEGYKLVVDNKNRQIETFRSDCEKLKKEVEFLKLENERKQQNLDKMHEHCSFLQKLVEEMREEYVNYKKSRN